jgi:2-polyprenyl-3-methyl-5-hydroxy-6-metoxy-1,4-benzoquinol methylase
MTKTAAVGYLQEIAPQHAGPQALDAQWTVVERCPACSARQAVPCGALPDRHYVFGSERVRFPDTGIAVMRCGACGLAYKAALPAPVFLAGVFERQPPAKWVGIHDFVNEARVLQEMAGKTAFDVLDAGAADGALLKACAEAGVDGRRSALDVVRYPGSEAHVTGEFIEGFLDTPFPAWSGDPYDAVTLFDVLEHLYEPRIAFENLRSLLKPAGLALIETGDSESFWPRRFGINQWWYVRLIEHHVFWSRHALERTAAVFGFEVVFWVRVRHKSRRRLRMAAAGDLLKAGLYCMAPDRYAAVARLFGKEGNQPWFPFARDHFRACLRKK